jgi:phospholipid/cholesterol/gamma-HCH transport system substrate-binding protein
MGAILARVDTIGTSISLLTKALQDEFVTNGGLRDLRRSVASISTVSGQLSTVIANQDRNISLLLSDFRRTTNRFAAMIDSAQVDSTVRNVRTMSANMTALVARVDSTNNQMRVLLAKANDGRGSLGMLLNDTTLYTNVRNLIATTDSLLNDFKKDPKKYINVRISVF